MSMRALLLLFTVGCIEVVGNPEPANLDDLADLARAYCVVHPELHCGEVWMCEAPEENELGHKEFCLLTGADKGPMEAEHGACEPTPRHPGPCIHCCGTMCGPGCNALNGCYCEAP